MSPRKRSPHVPGAPYTSWQAAQQLGRCKTWVTQQAVLGRFPGAVRDGRGWTLPADSVENNPGAQRTSMPPHLTVAEVAQRLELSAGVISQLCRRGDLPGATKDQGRWLIPESAVEAALRPVRVPRGRPAWWATAERARANGANSARAAGCAPSPGSEPSSMVAAKAIADIIDQH